VSRRLSTSSAGSSATVGFPASSAPADGILDAVGNTPLVRLRRLLSRRDVHVWAKLEAANPAGSSKDRSAAAMIAGALAEGVLRPGGTVIESSSGNLGVGLAQACRYHGLSFVCVVDTRAQPTKIQAMRALGAEVQVVELPDPETGDLLVARLKHVARLLDSIPGAYWPNQYANASNPAAHAAGTMREIDEALDGDVDLLLVATSTAGTLRGCCDYLDALERPTRVIAVDAVGSALFGGAPATRRLPGLGAGVETQLSLGARFDRLVRVSDLECVVGCRRLADREAILAGASSGAVAHALASVACELPAGCRCALILPDGGASYLDTVYRDAWVEQELGCDAAALAALVD
jgi:cysteine synthase A